MQGILKMKEIGLVVLFFLTGCVSIGGLYTPEGPHPRAVVAGVVHAGPAEIIHAPVSNAKPITDITVGTLNVGPIFGSVRPTLGVGWQFSQAWGVCDAQGQNCEKTWTNGWVAAAGLTYYARPFRADFRALVFDNSAVGARTDLPLGVEALVLMFGLDL